MNRGRFITVEGPDGAGKSTQITFINDWLERKGRRVITTREPGGTRAGEMIREIVLNSTDVEISGDTELMLIFAARRQHIDELINPALARGDWVLCDRFTDATYAYQGGGRGIPAERIAALEHWVQDGLQPDLTFVFDVPLAVGSSRMRGRGGNPDRFESEHAGFKEKVRDAYLARAKRFPDRIQVVNATQSVQAVQAEVEAALDRFFGGAG